jgi:acyl carrier protein
MQAIEQRIRSFIVENFLFGDEARAPLADDSFLELGIIDSTGVLELVEFIERGFGIKVKDVELLPENLDTVNALVAFVRRKAAAA